MNLRRLTITALLVMLSTAPAAAAQDVAQETETQRDARLAWWREARFGMFIHWGAYAVPAGTHKGERIAGIGEWIMSRAHIPIPEYEDYVHRFNPTRFDPDEWVRIAADAGMKYMIITSSAVLATAIGGVGEGGGVGGRSGLSSLPEPQQRLADRVAGHPIPASAPQHLTSVNRHHDRAAGSFRSHRVESVS